MEKRFVQAVFILILYYIHFSVEEEDYKYNNKGANSSQILKLESQEDGFTEANLGRILNSELPEDASLNFTGLAKKYGYKSSDYDVVTRDGYILKLFHIEGDRNTPVLLMHGLADTSDTFELRGNNSIMVGLAEQGFDLWFGNVRGNTYSRRHLRLNPDKDAKFWDFTFHEHATEDLPAIIDFILKKTGKKQLNVIGYSQGTLITFLLGATRTEYNAKIKLFVALAPVAYLQHIDFPYKQFATIAPILSLILVEEEFLSANSTGGQTLKFVCSGKLLSKTICRAIFSIFANPDIEGIGSEFFRSISEHFPSGTSKKNLIHYGQMTKRLAYFDYGTKNTEIYNETTSPSYNLTKITMKIALFVARNDKFSSLKDVERLKQDVKVVYEHLMEPEKWNHLEYVWGNRLRPYLIPRLVEVLNKYGD